MLIFVVVVVVVAVEDTDLISQTILFTFISSQRTNFLKGLLGSGRRSIIVVQQVFSKIFQTLF